MIWYRLHRDLAPTFCRARFSSSAWTPGRPHPRARCRLWNSCPFSGYTWTGKRSLTSGSRSERRRNSCWWMMVFGFAQRSHRGLLHWAGLSGFVAFAKVFFCYGEIELIFCDIRNRSRCVLRAICYQLKSHFSWVCCSINFEGFESFLGNWNSEIWLMDSSLIKANHMIGCELLSQVWHVCWEWPRPSRPWLCSNSLTQRLINPQSPFRAFLHASGARSFYLRRFQCFLLSYWVCWSWLRSVHWSFFRGQYPLPM